jgi:SAM-dependent methyltransferase
VSLDANARRFSGFADLYDAVRPVPPSAVATVITAYAGGRPQLVVDLGSGTGLSTRWAGGWASEVIGIEPSSDMRARAAAVPSDANIRYQPGWSNATSLPDRCADVVLAVQALHWMDPTSTFVEVARLLRPGGVFAAVDCDWPPSVGDARAEQAWHAARATIANHERELAGGSGEAPPARAASSSPQSDDLRPAASLDGAAESAVEIADGAHYWHKGEHLGRMVASQQFLHCGEVAALAAERGDSDRFVQLFRSQGDYQALRRHGIADRALGIDQFAAEVEAAIGAAERPFWFTYRARIGVRGGTGR